MPGIVGRRRASAPRSTIKHTHLLLPLTDAKSSDGVENLPAIQMETTVIRFAYNLLKAGPPLDALFVIHRVA